MGMFLWSSQSQLEVVDLCMSQNAAAKHLCQTPVLLKQTQRAIKARTAFSQFCPLSRIWPVQSGFVVGLPSVLLTKPSQTVRLRPVYVPGAWATQHLTDPISLFDSAELPFGQTGDRKSPAHHNWNLDVLLYQWYYGNYILMDVVTY